VILKEQIRGNASEARLKTQMAADRGLPPGFLAEDEWEAFKKMEAISAAIRLENPTSTPLEIEVGFNVRL